MNKWLKYVLMSVAGEGGGLGGSVLSNADSTAGGEGGELDWLPADYQVKSESGELDMTASAKKLSESYKTLETKAAAFGTVPDSVEGYAPELEVEGFNWDEYKTSPEAQSFLKGAHAKGISNDQLSYIMTEYAKELTQITVGNGALDLESVKAELKKTWATEQELDENVGLAARAFKAFASEEDQGRMDEIGNNPIVIRMLAKIGAEMKEDSPVSDSGSGDLRDDVMTLMRGEAYNDTKHPEHAKVKAQVDKYYEKKFGNELIQ